MCSRSTRTCSSTSPIEAAFKTEARAVLGEYNKNSADPLEKLFEVQRERFFQAHTYKHTTMGFIADIENMPNEYEYSKVFFERWYRPQTRPSWWPEMSRPNR